MQKETKSVPVVKSLNEDQKLATFVVLEPQDDDGMTTDGHSDWYSAEEVEKACHNFNRFCRKANLLHLVETDSFEFVESYITKAAMVLGDQYIKEGTWLATCYFKDDDLWSGVKDGTFNGLSIQGYASTQPIEE
jgi:hypothetical protein